ncbi:MAG TPA: hypothetical protein VFH93_10885 [Thermoleophilia bacterium]|nr:hypothetical protein [Thermoleophilia bacterium]
MRRRMLWIGAAALVVALSAATVAFAATQHSSTHAAKGVAFAASTAAPSVVPGACGALMNDPAAWKDMQAQRAEHQAAMQAWFDKYGVDSNSAAAQAALDQLRAEHWNDMGELLKKYGVDPAATPRGGATGGYGAGMMGGSGDGAGMMGGY